MVEESGSWVAGVPGKPAGTTIDYYVEVFDNEGNTKKSDMYEIIISYYSVHYSDYTIPAATVVILLLMFLVVFMFAAWGGWRKQEEREEIPPREAMGIMRSTKENAKLSAPQKLPFTFRKEPAVEVPKLSENEKRILFELESEKSALEDLLRNLDEKYRSRKIEVKEYYELYKEYKKELYLVEKRLREFKVKLGLRGTLRCMDCGLEIKSGEDIVFCRYCNSPAHREHLLEWLHIKGICPYCRHFLRESDLL